MKRIRGTFVGLGAIAALCTFAGTALADTVGNPGDFTLDVPSGQDSVWSYGTHSVYTSGSMDISVDAAGAITFSTASFNSVTTAMTTSGSGLPISAELVVAPASSSGTINPTTGQIDLTIHARWKFTWASSPTCQTSFFDIPISTRNGSGWAYRSSTDGHFRADDDGSIAVPAISSGCANATNQATINNYMGFGQSAGSVGYKFDYGVIDSPDKVKP